MRSRISAAAHWRAQRALAQNDQESLARRPAFEQALKALGWTNGSNLRVDYRWGAADDADRARKYAVALAPDVILASGSSAVAPYNVRL